MAKAEPEIPAGRLAATGKFWKSWSYRCNRVIRKIIRASGTPHQVALGIAIGFFFGVMLVPGQYPIALVVCTIFGANRLMPLLPVWISNPATVVPLYTFNYWVGWLLVGGPGVKELQKILKQLMPDMADLEIRFFDTPYLWIKTWILGAWDNFWEDLDAVKNLGMDLLLPFYLGSALVGLVLGVASYYTTLYIIKVMAVRLEEKRRRRQQRIDASANGNNPAETAKTPPPPETNNNG